MWSNHSSRDGKLARRKGRKNLTVDLPADIVDDSGHVEGRHSPLETALAAIWADLLQVPRVALTDNFFDLGGHSLLAMRVVSSVRQNLQVDVSLASIFETSTFADFAASVSKARQHVPSFEDVLSEVENMTDEEAARALDPPEEEP